MRELWMLSPENRSGVAGMVTVGRYQTTFTSHSFTFVEKYQSKSFSIFILFIVYDE